jgi:hypothetical protein
LIRAGHLLVFATCLASCGEKERKQAQGSDVAAKPGRSDTRAPRQDAGEPDPRALLRESFDTALASEDPAEKVNALERIAWDGIDVDPELSREAFAMLPLDSEARSKLAAHFAMRLAEADPAQAVEWARGLGEGEREEALGRVAVVISAKEPERAAELIAEHLPAGSRRDRAVVQVVQRWTQQEPSAAAEWVGAFDAGAARSAGLKVALAGWLEEDAASAARWIGDREDATLRMECLAATAEHLRSAGGSARAARLAAFSDPEIRRQLENLLAQPRP